MLVVQFKDVIIIWRRVNLFTENGFYYAKDYDKKHSVQDFKSDIGCAGRQPGGHRHLNWQNDGEEFLDFSWGLRNGISDSYCYTFRIEFQLGQGEFF